MKKIAATIVMIVIMLGAYYFPIQYILAKIKYNEYSAMQGVTEEDIQSMYIHKDYVQGGYYIDVTYYSDPDYQYSYQYFIVLNTKQGLKTNLMFCEIYDTSNHCVEDYTNVVYPPVL